ncbi:class II aldolase/adducin family protein [Micromonospora sp. NPDC023966]|uniref:class II aldolase/adducin family protein n=1 Tax=Micromonospora sp. NPDC023966 TaxID=3154699 RepID=UPI0033EEDFA1
MLKDADPTFSPAGDPSLRHEIATACRIAAFRGLCEDVLGHISSRHPGGLLMRCRRPQERGLLFTTADDILLTGPDGALLEPADGAAVPNEIHIHTEILRARPDVDVVLHAHPPAIVALDMVGLSLVPVVGAYNIPAARMARDGIPTYPRSVLVNTPALGRELVAALGEKDVCVMRGHGLVTTGRTVKEALSRALSLDALARVMLLAAGAGQVPAGLPDADLAQLPDLGAGFNDEQNWRFQVSALALAGLAIPERGSSPATSCCSTPC